MFRTAVLTLAATLWATTGALSGGCGTGNCSVGAFGQGGVASEGNAQGFHVERPSTLYPSSTYTNVGNDDAGRIDVSGQGTLQGTYRNEISRGHETGIFGDASGHI